jgi:hypothetical protein
MSRWSRLVPLCGVLFVALLVGSFAWSGNSPGVKASGAKVIQFYTAHHDAQQNSAFLGMYAAVLFLFFAAWLRGYLRRTAQPAAGTLAALSFGGAVLFAAGGTLQNGLQFALSDAPGSLSAGAAQALNVLDNDLFLPLIVGGCVFMIANGIAAVRLGVLPAWLGWIAILIGVVTVTPVGFVGFLAVLGWVLVASVVLTVREWQATPAVSPGQPVDATT